MLESAVANEVAPTTAPLVSSQRLVHVDDNWCQTVFSYLRLRYVGM